MIVHIAGPFLVKIQSAVDSDEVNVVRSNLQKMSTAAVDETSSEKVISSRHGLFARKLHIVLITPVVKASKIRRTLLF